MSDEESPQKKPRLLAVMVVGGLVLLVLVGYFIFFNHSTLYHIFINIVYLT